MKYIQSWFHLSEINRLLKITLKIRFQITPLIGSKFYLLPRIITINTYQSKFRYKILHNILCLNKKMHIFGKIDSLLCSVCHSNDETVSHLYCDCVRVNQLWS